MKKKTILISLLVIFPVIFTFLNFAQLSGLDRVTFRMQTTSADQEVPVCENPDISLAIASGCICPDMRVLKLGFPARWNGYGYCNQMSNTTAKLINVGIGLSVELLLAATLIHASRKK